MPYTVGGGFSALLADLDLTPRQKEIAEGRVSHLETYFDKYIVCSKLPFKIGSYERGSFENVRALVAAIERFTRQWNDGASPFRWVKTPDEILAKAVRKTQATSGARH